MEHFTKIRSGLDVAPLRAQIEARPDLWNVNGARISSDNPFSGTSDQWLRYRAPEDLNGPDDYRQPHFAVNYPSWHALPAAQEIVFDLMRTVRAVHLGGVLLTKIPAGGRIKPHHDRGSWHAEKMNCKIYVPVSANEKCVNYCGGESLVIRPGDAVSFNNLITHSVENNGETDRITLIICMRLCDEPAAPGASGAI